MTNEKAKDLLDNLIGVMEDNHDNDYDTALKMGIRAIGTLEKIREEVCKLYPCYRIDRDYPSGIYDGKCWVIHKVVDIIDKYANIEQKGAK